jgi:hypothetical protein
VALFAVAFDTKGPLAIVATPAKFTLFHGFHCHSVVNISVTNFHLENPAMAISASFSTTSM